jgi:uncharacterized repeat protein (TIGR03803 family)
MRQSTGPRTTLIRLSDSFYPMKSASLPRRRLLILMTLLVVFAGSAFAGSKYQVIHRFQQSGIIGNNPTDLIADSAGNLYGTTDTGGKYGFGSVYGLVAPQNGGAWTIMPLYSFRSAVVSLIPDQSGVLYGANQSGGHCGQACGTVFRLTPPKDPGGGWTESDLYVFGGWDGAEPGGLVWDQQGNLYGTTAYGGRGCSAIGCGTVFKLTPSGDGKAWTRTTLYFFKGVRGDRGEGDGEYPLGVTFDPKGNLYGVTLRGGQCDQGICYGAAFELEPPTKNGGHWTERVLYRFPSPRVPYDQLNSGVVLDKSGALYGSTDYFVYQLALEKGVWTENILSSEAYIYSGLVVDEAGNLYGTTSYNSEYTSGTVFKLSPPDKNGGTWTQTLLHVFASGRDGQAPVGGVTFGLDGALYGTTLLGGNNQCQIDDGVGCGIVFTVAP